MNSEKWGDIKEKIKSSFVVEDEYEEQLDPGVAEIIEFTTPHGLLRAVFTRKPRVIGKKTLYSRRSAGDVKVDYTYSKDEEVSYLSVERWNAERDMWEKLQSTSLF